MRTIIVNGVAELYEQRDPDAASESEFEFHVAKALSSVYPSHQCIVFGGGFRYDDRICKPDLALVARDFSHWFVIEVEVVSHSLDGHVLPQVRGFRYGDPQPDCSTILARELKVDMRQARTLVELVPRSVAVIANKRDQKWEVALNAHEIQLLIVSVFRSAAGVLAAEVEGGLEVLKESLGFGTYSATDRSLRFPKAVRLSLGQVQINDPRGTLSSWTVAESSDSIWVTKDEGVPNIKHGAYVQLIRTVEGRLSLRQPKGGN